MSKETCPKCSAPIDVDHEEIAYDEQRYSCMCPACNTHLIATADVSIKYELEIAEPDPDDGGPKEYCDESVRVRLS